MHWHRNNPQPTVHLASLAPLKKAGSPLSRTNRCESCNLHSRCSSSQHSYKNKWLPLLHPICSSRETVSRQPFNFRNPAIIQWFRIKRHQVNQVSLCSAMEMAERWRKCRFWKSNRTTHHLKQWKTSNKIWTSYLRKALEKETLVLRQKGHQLIQTLIQERDRKSKGKSSRLK